MTDVVLDIEKWSREVADSAKLGEALAADDARTEKEIREGQMLQAAGANRFERAELLAAGKTPPSEAEAQDLKAKINHLADIRLARELHAKKDAEIRRREGSRLCLALKPEFDASAKDFANALVVAYGAMTKMAALESTLKAQNVGFYPIVCNVDFEKVLGWPTDRTSGLARLFRECVQHGHLRAMPRELA